MTVEFCQRWQQGECVFAKAVPVAARVAHEVHIAQELVMLQRAEGQQAGHRYKVHGQVQLLQGLAALQVFNLRDVVQRQIQILQLLQPVQILNFRYQVALEQQNLEVPASTVQQLDLFDVLLVQSQLLEIRDHALVVLRPLHVTT